MEEQRLTSFERRCAFYPERVPDLVGVGELVQRLSFQGKWCDSSEDMKPRAHKGESGYPLL